jgi:hypothetical protein
VAVNVAPVDLLTVATLMEVQVSAIEDGHGGDQYRPDPDPPAQ